MEKTRFLFLSALVASSVIAAEPVRIAVDAAVKTGPVKAVNGVGQPPMIGQLGSWSMMHYLKEAGIPYARLHDVGGWLGRGLYVDIPNLFPDFDADETNPGNYRFAYTDSLMKALVENGVEPFFRLGVTIENFVERGYPPVHSIPPKDFAKWGRICEHVIRHYTEGWADGFRYKIEYWEIWNEPDNMPDPERNPLWRGSFRDFMRLYGTVAPYLKAKFPHLKIGGYASCGFYAGVGAGQVKAANSSPRLEYFIECAKNFLAAARDNRWPLDFFSYHSYSDPKEVLRQVAYADALLNEYGFTADRTERVFNEWLPYVSLGNLGTALQAAGIAATIVGLQNGPCDVACVYDARCDVGSFSPLFNPLTQKPHKAYYAFVAFNELRKLGTAVRCTSSDPNVYAAAAASGGKTALMAVNLSDKPVPVAFTGLPGKVECRLTDGARTHAAVPLPSVLPAYSFVVATGQAAPITLHGTADDRLAVVDISDCQDQKALDALIREAIRKTGQGRVVLTGKIAPKISWSVPCTGLPYVRTRAECEETVARLLGTSDQSRAKEAAKKALATVPEVVYVTRTVFANDHHNTATIFQYGEINQNSYRTQGALKAWNPATGAVRTIVPEKKGRTVRDPEVDAEGRRIVFSMRDGRMDDYHVYVINADGTGLKQLTSAKGVSDIDPVFLPDGGIVFSSTREPKYCMCNRHIMCNLFRMDADGANIHQIGKSTLFEGHATVLPDGRILYDRWEYVDRNFGDAQGLWTCNPDGTRHAIWWGNNTTSPGGVLNARCVGDDASKVIAILASCHDRPWGALGLIDRTRGVDGAEPVLRTWPASFHARIHAGGREDFDSTRLLACKYADPFPIDERRFLAVRQTGRASGEMSLVYLDLDGNETEVLRDAPGIWSPVILRPTKPAPIQSTQRHFKAPDAPGFFYVQDVYVGTHMKGVKPGAVKALRIVESPPKKNWTRTRGWFGHGEMAPAMNWHSFENKRILGTVPVEKDGSAYFEVPGNTFVYFQALDENGMMIQSMRSGAYVQPGEKYGCVGCHENRVGEAAPVMDRPMALRRAPSKLDGWYGPARLFSFQKEVQPVFTKHCLSCHDYGGSAAAKLNLSGDRGAYFCTSYVDLWACRWIHCIGGGPAEIQPAYSWGASASKLTKKLFGHGRTALTDEERDRVITWMDINAPYYPRYESAYPAGFGGRMPLTAEECRKLETLCGVEISCQHARRQREQLNFDRPDRSRILAKITGPAREEALALIRKGAERLRKTPRGDTEDGFVPCAADRAREERHQKRLAEEKRVYEAIRTGRKHYERPRR